MADERLTIAYELSLSGLAQQESVLDQLRARANILLSASAVVTAFLGAQALRLSGTADVNRGLDVAAWVALFAFVFVGAAVLLVLWPWTKWKFRLSARSIIAGYVETVPPATPDIMRRELALHIERQIEANARRLSLLFWYFRAGCLALIVEVVAWMVKLA